MSDSIHSEIRSDRLIRKFCAYGFLKNLNFFEPYLLIFLMGKGISLFEAAISFSKDLIQPILEAIILGSCFVVPASLSGEDNLHILLGIVYTCLNLFGSVASRKAYLLRQGRGCIRCLFLIHLGLALSMGLLAPASGHPLPVPVIYLLIYFLFNVRKPIFVDEIDEHIEKSARATALSVSSQLKSLSLTVLAPTAGWVADHFGLPPCSCFSPSSSSPPSPSRSPAGPLQHDFSKIKRGGTYRLYSACQKSFAEFAP